MSPNSEDMLNKVPPSLPLVAVIDGDIVKTSISFAEYGSDSKDQRCRSLLIGDCGFDVRPLTKALQGT